MTKKIIKTRRSAKTLSSIKFAESELRASCNMFLDFRLMKCGLVVPKALVTMVSKNYLISKSNYPARLMLKNEKSLKFVM